MSIRLLALIVIGILSLPFMVLLRSGNASPPDYCRLKAEVFLHIASERDRGVPEEKFLKGFEDSMKAGKIRRQTFLVFKHWTAYVYKSPNTGLDLYEETIKSCRAMRNIEA